MSAVGPKIALVTPGYPPHIGGVERVVGRLAEGLAGLGCEVHVLAQCRRHEVGRLAARCQRPGVTVSWFPDWTGTRRFPVSPGLWRHLRRHGHSYDLVHAHGFHASPAVAAAVATDVPLVFQPHFHGGGHTPLARVAHLGFDPVAGRVFRRAASILCVSAAEAASVGAAYPTWCDRLAVVPNGVDLDEVTAAVPFPDRGPLILVAGRLEAYKRVERAVESVPHLESDARLVVAGAGPEQVRLRRVATRLGVADRVRLLGPVSTADLRRWQRTAAVAVTLSEHEAFGLVMAEAAAGGANIVASDIAAHREMAAVVGAGVELMPHGASPRQVAAAIDRALVAPRRRLPITGIRGWGDVCAEVLGHYRAVLRSVAAG